MRVKPFYLPLAYVIVILLSTAGLGSNEQKTAPLKVGVLLSGPVADLGWNSTHDQARKFLEKELHGKVQTTVAEKIPDNAEAERVMEKMIAQGVRLIFATSYGYLEPVLRVAARHPEVIFMQCERSVPTTVKNVGSYFVDPNGPLYITGVVAGRLTKTGKIGCVAAHPIAVVLSTFNSFALGVQRANPKARIQIVWTSCWNDPTIESEATKGLIDSGVDVIFSEMSSAMTIVQTAAKNGVYSAGCCMDLEHVAPKSWLTGQNFNWGALYVKTAQSVIDHTWKPGNNYYGMKEGYSQLSKFGTVVPESVKNEAMLVKRNMESGKIVIFKGPLRDQNGLERVKPGELLDSKALTEMNWIVEGVQGPMPKQP
jgi:basic membrane protein A